MGFDLRRLDVYRKVPADLTQPTYFGAAISVGCIIFITTLLIYETYNFFSPELVSDLYVDNPAPSEKIIVFLNISLPKLSCDVVGLDIQDENGRHEVGHIDNTEKTVLNDGKGCNFVSKFTINKVPGNFHVSTHAAKTQPDDIDMSHEIHSLTFGEQLIYELGDDIKGSFNALQNHDRLKADGKESHDYVMKIVPTVYELSSGDSLVGYQYTHAHKSYITLSFSAGRIIPAIWFKYDLNPITVRYHRRTQPLYSFLTNVCAIVGGTFTVVGIINSICFTAGEVFRKFEMGKLS
ncbi:endoplasmic reticulum-Golgi intermediate compartment protein 1 [Galendromus occidentalis]|uniref:Endoplasmic reticulum-Golgi intermediate compartment protein 1 n=1 Tax=Galendromus occidentalis TaxID=34638 RepID=A0AAJ6VY93_9ACAR|nr:endoplasmic reticulum-Golgi intermediate compartment protein 1 [Galendromus occidentalis]